MSAGTDRSHPLHVRLREPPPPSSTSIRSVCDTRVAPYSRPASSSAARITGTVMVWTLSPPPSMSYSTVISACARSLGNTAASSPEARIHSRSPTSPKRSRTGPRPSCSRSAQLVMPRLARRSTAARIPERGTDRSLTGRIAYPQRAQFAPIWRPPPRPATHQQYRRSIRHPQPLQSHQRVGRLPVPRHPPSARGRAPDTWPTPGADTRHRQRLYRRRR